jgi:hypothetical protein
VRQIELLQFTIDALDRLGIAYAVVGSYASGAWGEPRMTRDIDFVIRLAADQVDSLCAAFPDVSFYVSRSAAAEAVERRSQFNVIHPASGNKIDFMVLGTGDWPDSQLVRRTKVTFQPGATGYVAAPDDVILGKLIYYRDGGSEKHLRDIRGILKISGDFLDRDYLARSAVQLGVADIWHAILGERD